MIALSPAVTSPPSSPEPPLDRQRALAELERHHPDLWRAGQLGRAASLPVWPTGYDALSAQLPGGGWPVGAVTELLVPDHGVGEVRLLRPALQSLTEAGRRLIWIGAPHAVNAPALAAWGLPARQVYWVRAGEGIAGGAAEGTRKAVGRAGARGGRAAAQAAQQADLLWAAEQVLRSQAFGGVLVWLPSARPEAVRRLQVLAQASEAVVWVCRPAAALRESSPAVLRLLLSPLPGNALSIVFHKRRGPVRDTPLILPLGTMPAVPAGRSAVSEPANETAPQAADEAANEAANEPFHESDHAVLDRGASAAPAAGRAAPHLA
ncbi:damage-inducible protein [Cupriavidus gilardii]|uniref:damage-inducible protein n=1 Tax=Cupriavidus gilardii TaxID=82541 RepID=UPI0015741547|nr:damage-inducible protein [Cupriavidus gilardii]NSX02651.1 damage-inducible protein [Cupriavidus gilardii]